MSAEDCFSYVVPGSNEKHRRARNWTDSEMKGLLYIWEEYVTELKKAKRNAKIYETMAKRLYELTGEHRHREEIKMKITNMTFQYRKLKYTAGGSTGTPDWPYYKSIERILSKVPEQTHMSPMDPQTTGASTSQPESSLPQPAAPMIGFLSEYTGSSEEREVKEEEDGTEISVSSFESSKEEHLGNSGDQWRDHHQCPRSGQDSRSQTVKRRRISPVPLRRKKLRVMEAMLQEQRKMRHAVEETCREVRRVMQQQNFLQVQSLQLQDRMMNLLEKMIPVTAAKPTHL